jgi:hypothetical protein
MDQRTRYFGVAASREHASSEYLTGGRFFRSIERQQGEEMRGRGRQR